MQSDLHRPEHARGRVRGKVAASFWSVLPALAIVVVIGGLFWATVWAVLRMPGKASTGAGPEVIVAAVPADDEPEDAAGVDESDVPAGRESSVEAATKVFDEDASAAIDEDATADADGGATAAVDRGATANVDAAWSVAAGAAAEDVVGTSIGRPTLIHAPSVASGGSALDEVALGPLYGPFLEDMVAGESGAQEAVASGDADGDLVADAGEQAASRAEEIAARAEDLATRAEELTARIEGLTTRIEELQTKLEATGGALVDRPVAVASPVPAPRANEQVVARAGLGQGPGAAGATTIRTSSSQTSTQQAAPSAAGRAPWVVLPQPEPGSKVTAGALVLEARARGEAPITQIRLVLDGVALPVAMEKRDDTTWRGRTTTRVSPGSHTVAVAVVDGQGRTGSYRWQFDASGS